jgi:hypothetical protein
MDGVAGFCDSMVGFIDGAVGGVVSGVAGWEEEGGYAEAEYGDERFHGV